MKTKTAEDSEIISQHEIETQNQLIDALRENGINSTQATVSRDIRSSGW